MPPPPFIISGSGCPTPSREQVPVCPVTTCFPGLQPTTSLPHFLSSACQKDADCSALPPRGRRAHRPPRRPSTVQWPRRGPELACPAPLQRLPAPGLEKTKQNKQKPCCPKVLTFYQPVLSFIISQADPLRQERRQSSIVSLSSLPFSGLCSPMKNKTKQNETPASPKSFLVLFLVFVCVCMCVFFVFCFFNGGIVFLLIEEALLPGEPWVCSAFFRFCA